MTPSERQFSCLQSSALTCRARLGLTFAARQIHQVQLSHANVALVTRTHRIPVNGLDRDREDGMGA